VTEAGRRTALTVCNGVDQTLIDLASLTGHADHDEPMTRTLYMSNSSGPLSITLSTPTYDVAYLLLYEGLITEIECSLYKLNVTMLYANYINTDDLLANHVKT